MTVAPNRKDLQAYLDMIFGFCEAGEENAAYCIALRGLGEKGTDKEGDFRDIQIIPPIQSSFDVDRIFGHVQRWSQHGRASFIVPACVAPAALSDKHATEDRILLLTTIVVDIDTGNTDEKLAHAVKYLGTPTMVVSSGGTTDTGHAKVHSYWQLSEPSADVARIAEARKLLALKIGGDAAFGRSTQVIRIPGSVYNKGGVARPCFIQQSSTASYELDDLLDAINAMPVLDGVKVEASKVVGSLLPVLSAPQGGLNFSAFKDVKGDLKGEKDDIGLTLTRDIVEGGDEDRNRWSEFNRTAGVRIADARAGRYSLDTAKAETWAWIEQHMKPAWPPLRFEGEWKALVERDIRGKGPMPGVPIAQQNQQVIDVVPGLSGYSVQPKLSDWAVTGWAAGEKPKRKFLVDGLVIAGKAHMLAAEGGAGKTFMLLDLAAKIASHTPDQIQTWCGLPLSEDAGGTVVMFTTEDDKDELHIRLADIVPKDRLQATKDRLVIIPTINIGGAFALVEKQRASGPALIGAQWGAWLEQLSKVQDLRLVIIDTLNTTLHGEENSATVINEYVQAAAAYVCGKFGASLVVTHHVRKPGTNTKIYTAEDMKNSIRGSTALIGAFRATLGIWHAPDYKERLTRIGKAPKPGQLYNFAVVKANNPEMAFEPRTLLREPSGLLIDITDKERSLIANAHDEAAAWLCKAVAYGAEKEHPFTVKSVMKKPPNGRKHQLPAMLQAMSERKLQDLSEQLLEEGRLVQCNPKGKTTYNHLDIPGGPLAAAMGSDGGAYRIAEGADFEPPSWEHAFAYHPVEGRIVRRGDEGKRTVGGTRLHGCTPSSATAASGATGLRFSPDCSNEPTA